MKSFKVGLNDVGSRADVFVAQKYPEFARSALHKLFERGQISINSKTQKAGYKLKFNDKVKVDDKELKIETDDIILPIIYEDENIIVIDKPSGVLSHSNGGLNHEASVASFIRSKLSKDISNNNERAGIVHRLDRATSGVMVCAKNQASLSYLQKQFQNRKVEKTYIAISDKTPKNTEALIDAPIGRDLKNPKTFVVKSSGKPAQTHYVVKSSTNSGISYIELKPKTGRTHQIRVHLAYIGCPIVGDFLYGGANSERLMLHASNIKLRKPGGDLVEFKSQTPSEFKVFVNAHK